MSNCKIQKHELEWISNQRHSPTLGYTSVALTIKDIDLCNCSTPKFVFTLQKFEELKKQNRTAETDIITLKNEKAARKKIDL